MAQFTAQLKHSAIWQHNKKKLCSPWLHSSPGNRKSKDSTAPKKKKPADGEQGEQKKPRYNKTEQKAFTGQKVLRCRVHTRHSLSYISE